jgi:hypothetical protein
MKKLGLILALPAFASPAAAQTTNTTTTCKTVFGQLQCDSASTSTPPPARFDPSIAINAYNAGVRARLERDLDARLAASADQEKDRIGYAALADAPAPVSPQPTASALPRPLPNARELYVGCSLYVRGDDVAKGRDGYATNYSSVICGFQSLAAIANRESMIAGKNNALRFCLPKTAEATQDPTRAMAYAYLDYFERIGSRMADKDGATVFIVAMIDKWPCESPKP